MKLTKRNLRNIKGIFQEKTGVELSPPRRTAGGVPVKKILVAAAIIAGCLMLAAFAYPLFTPLEGDELSLKGEYLGNGIVSVYVENKSDKDLKFQEQLRLINWFTEEEAPKLDGAVVFTGTKFPAGTSGTMTIDLSGAYDLEYLENDVANPWYYLLLTNQNFLFGHDWMCSVFFNEYAGEEAEEAAVEAPAEHLEAVEEELRFYFEEAYEGAPIAFNEANFPYLQKLDEVLARFDGNVVSALSPTIMVGEASQYLSPEPGLKDVPDGVILDDAVPADQQYLLALDEWTYSDAYGRLVASGTEKAWVIHGMIPQRQGETDGGAAIPLVFLFVYDAEAAADPENYAYIYGQLLSFGQLEQYKVLADDHYAIYDATDLIYTDVDAYLDYFLSTRADVFCDAQIRQRIRNIYGFYRDRETLANLIYYREMN